MLDGFTYMWQIRDLLPPPSTSTKYAHQSQKKQTPLGLLVGSINADVIKKSHKATNIIFWPSATFRCPIWKRVIKVEEVVGKAKNLGVTNCYASKIIGHKSSSNASSSSSKWNETWRFSSNLYYCELLLVHVKYGMVVAQVLMTIHLAFLPTFGKCRGLIRAHGFGASLAFRTRIA